MGVREPWVCLKVFFYSWTAPFLVILCSFSLAPLRHVRQQGDKKKREQKRRKTVAETTRKRNAAQKKTLRDKLVSFFFILFFVLSLAMYITVFRFSRSLRKLGKNISHGKRKEEAERKVKRDRERAERDGSAKTPRARCPFSLPIFCFSSFSPPCALLSLSSHICILSLGQPLCFFMVFIFSLPLRPFRSHLPPSLR